MATHHLAQINIAHLKVSIDDPMIADFVAELDHINQLAENSDGFIWRLQDETGAAISFDPYNDPSYIVNISVWQDASSLRNFVYKSNHVQVYLKRAQWFHPMNKAHMALWWIPQGHLPSIAEAIDKLAIIDKHGISKQAFTFKQLYEAP